MHVSLDGYVAGPDGDMSWIKLSNDLWDDVTNVTNGSDMAIFGATTYKLMEAYWPTADKQPNATKHDIEHSRWVNNTTKLVFSKEPLQTDWQGTTVKHDLIKEEIVTLKNQPGKNLLMLGSPTLAQSFMQLDLIDEFRLNVNPVVLGGGKKLFDNIHRPISLTLTNTRTFDTGVVGLTYTKI